MSEETGIAWWTEPGSHQPVYLLVDGGRVTACTPYAERWALGRTTGHLEQRGRDHGATLEWIPLSEPATLFLTHQRQTRPIRRWLRHCRQSDTHLTFGETGNGFYVDDTAEKHAWRYALATEAWAECRRRMQTGSWDRVNATYGPHGEKRGIEDDPDLPDGLDD